MPSCERLTRDRPPSGLHFQLLHEPSTDRVLLACPSEGHRGVDVWHFDAGRWTRVAERLLAAETGGEDIHVAAVVAWVDPTAQSAVVGAIVKDGLLTTSLGKTTELRRRAFDFGERMFHPRVHSLWHPARNAPVLVVCHDNDATILEVGDESLEVIEAEAPHLIAASVVADAGAVLAHDVSGNLYVLDDEGLRELDMPPARLNGLAWHASLDTVISFGSENGEEMFLTKWTEEGFVNVDPPVTCPIYRSGGKLLVKPDEQIIYFGGQDFERDGRLADSALFTPPGGRELVSDAASDPPLGSYTTLLTMGGRLLLANHSTMRVHAWDGERWPVIREAPKGHFDARFVQFAAGDDALFALDAKGLWKDGMLVAGDAGGPGAHYTHRVALGWDPPTKRLVVFGGHDCNSTWVADERGFAELRPANPPPHGIGTMASTPEGVHLLVENTLYRFEANAWRCVAKDVPGFFLLYDARRNRFLTGGDEKRKSCVWVLDANGIATPAAELPRGLRFGDPSTHRLEAGIDHERDLLVMVAQKGGSWKLPLGAIESTSRGIPREAIAAPSTRLATPPAEWRRDAIRLTEAEQIEAPDIDGLVAIVRTDAGTIAIVEAEDADLGSLAWGIGTCAHHARFVEHGAELVVSGATAKRLVRTPFPDVDPDHVTEVDTPPGRADAFAYGSKIGGYPRFVQDDATKSWEGPPLRFLVQLSSDLVTVGDVGRLYVWITEEPTPRLLVLTQSH